MLHWEQISLYKLPKKWFNASEKQPASSVLKVEKSLHHRFLGFTITEGTQWNHSKVRNQLKCWLWQKTFTMWLVWKIENKQFQTTCIPYFFNIWTTGHLKNGNFYKWAHWKIFFLNMITFHLDDDDNISVDFDEKQLTLVSRFNEFMITSWEVKWGFR